MQDAPRTVLCLASYEKGQEFIREGKRLGHRVLLLTETSLQDAAWPRESLDDIFYMPDLSRIDDVIKGVSYLARSEPIDRIVALDDYDVETVAALREHLRLPGMDASTARRFRDKLAMRVAAQEAGILVPDFVPILNYARIQDFLERVPPPWILKPRAEVSTIGISTIASSDELWARLEALGDRQSFYVLERFIPGDVYHVDSIVVGGQVVFAETHRYGRPPLATFHEGGIALTRTLPRGSQDERVLQALNQRVITALGMARGVTHMEFIKGPEGQFYFLEVGARVGGANTAEMVEAATGINLWREWARLEVGPEPYHLPPRRYDYAGTIVSLARQERPDTAAYQEPEIVWRLDKRHHVGLVVAAPSQQRVETLLEDYHRRITDDFLATAPPYEERPPSHP